MECKVKKQISQEHGKKTHSSIEPFKLKKQFLYDMDSIEKLIETDEFQASQAAEHECLLSANYDLADLTGKLIAISGSQRREKARKGVYLIAQTLTGKSKAEMIAELGVTEQYYRVLLSEGRKVLRQDPSLLRYIQPGSMKKSSANHQALSIRLHEEPFQISYADSIVYDVPPAVSKDPLQTLAGVIQRDAVSDTLLYEVPVDKQVIILDGDHGITSRATVGTDHIIVDAVMAAKQNAKPRQKKRKAATANTLALLDAS